VPLDRVTGEVPPPTPSDGPDPYGEPDPEWLKINWRQHLHRVDVVGTEVNYVEMGSGEPAILVHGLGGSWQNWLDNIPHLARHHRVIALDLPGFGDSQTPSWEATIENYGRLLHDFCEKIGVGSCNLVGSSMGGFISTELAINEPQRVDRLVLVSAAGITYARLRREPMSALGRVTRAAAPLAFRYRMEGLRRPWLRHLAYRGLVYDPRGIRKELLWEITHPALQAESFYEAMTNLAGYDSRHRLEEIEVPTLVVWGRNDRVVPSNAAPEYQRLIGENARLEVFARCGHLPMLERPVRFNRLMDSFLAE
jgi:pimeloyl-ACP methyl ester carboxylesterase